MAVNSLWIRWSGRRVWTALAVVGAVGLSGCVQEDDSGSKIVKARATMASLGASGVAAPSAARAKAYDQVIASMQGIGGGGGSGAAIAGASAKLIAAQAMLGQGVILGDAQRMDETAVTRAAETARVKLELFVKYESLAASLAGHDLTEAVGELKDKITELEASVSASRGAEAETRTALEKLNGMAEGVMSQARSKRDEAGQLRAALQSVSGEARLPMVEEISKRQREADLLEVEHARMELGVNDLKRKLDEIGFEVGQFQRRVELAQASVKRSEDSAALLKEQNATARAKATEIGTEVGAALEALAGEIDQKLKASYEAAKSKYESASSTASGGSAADGALAKALAGAGQQALAALHGGYAGALENAVDAATRIGAQNGLGSATKGREWAAAWMEEVKAARDASASASAQAGASFQGANPKGPGAEILKRLGDKLLPPAAAEPEIPVDAAAPADAPAGEVPAGEEPKGDAPAETPPPAADTPAETPAETPSETPGSPEPK
ncbi:MAG: hypothetical protein ACKVZJ_14165 [Phycisphaerales bacterium]